MIPYDDLVAALASWRARQGLPTGQLAGQPAAPAAAPKPTPGPAPAAAPPRPTPASSRPAAVVMEPTHEDPVDVDESSLLEESSYESDFAMTFPGGEPGDSTAIGAAPAPRPASDDDEGPARPPPPRRRSR
jgi:hypothetical protein